MYSPVLCKAVTSLYSSHLDYSHMSRIIGEAVPNIRDLCGCHVAEPVFTLEPEASELLNGTTSIQAPLFI